MTKIITVCLAAAIGWWAALAPRDSKPASEDVSPKPDVCVVESSATMEGIDELCDQALALIAATDAAGGLEATSAAFHDLPGNSVQSLFVYPAFFIATDPNGVASMHRIILDVRRQEVMSKGVVLVDIVDSPTHQGFHDVRVKFNASIPELAKQMQAQRELAFAASQAPHDQGLALIYHGAIYGDFTYGEIALAAGTGEGWVTVVSGTTADEAIGVAAALQP